MACFFPRGKFTMFLCNLLVIIRLEGINCNLPREMNIKKSFKAPNSKYVPCQFQSGYSECLSINVNAKIFTEIRSRRRKLFTKGMCLVVVLVAHTSR